MAFNCEIRVATELEYSGISLNMKNSGNSVEPQGKTVTNKVVLIRHSSICIEQLLTGYTGSLQSQGVTTLPSKGHYYIYFLLQ